jgi:nucleoside-diphosphate-sugar epimerase
MVLEMTGHKAEIRFLPDMPTGPINRVAENYLAKKLMSWEPQVSFRDGLQRTIDWYYSHKNRSEVEHVLEGGGFIARKVPAKMPS